MARKDIAEGVGRYFATSVGLITSTGSHGHDVMAAEWTMQISYEPMLIAVFIHKSHATYDNIRETGEFGVNMSTDEQADLVNIAGGYSKTELDKLSAGGLFRLYRARYIRAPMIHGCIINAECRVVKRYDIGDHTAVIGEVLHAKFDGTKSPLIYHRGSYRSARRKINVNRREVAMGRGIYEELERMLGKGFRLQCAAALVRNGKKETLFVKGDPKVWDSKWTLPWFVIGRGGDHAETLRKRLGKMNLDGVKMGGIAGVERLTFRNGSRKLRANFVVYRCSTTTGKAPVNGAGYFADARWIKTAPKKIFLKGLLRFN